MSDNGDVLRGKFDVVEAQSFVLRAPDGTKRAVLGMADEKVFLALLDGEEQHRMALVLTDGTPSIQFIDEGRLARVAVVLDSQGTPKITLYDENGLVRVAVALDSDGTPGINLYDESQNACLTVAILPDGGGANIRITDENGTERVFLTLIEGTHMEFFDGTGKCIFSAPAKGRSGKRQ